MIDQGRGAENRGYGRGRLSRFANGRGTALLEHQRAAAAVEIDRARTSVREMLVFFLRIVQAYRSARCEAGNAEEQACFGGGSTDGGGYCFLLGD